MRLHFYYTILDPEFEPKLTQDRRRILWINFTKCGKRRKEKEKNMDHQENKKKKLSHYELCLKEFKICGILTLAYILSCCLLCWIFGYGQSGAGTTFIFGIPTWAAVGVFVPWILMVIITTVYGLFLMEGDEE